jgi:hypothetical protein
MTFDERLDRAREDYRTGGATYVDDGAPATPPSRRHRPRLALAAAAAVVVLVAGAMWWRIDHAPDQSLRVVAPTEPTSEAPPTEVTPSPTTNPPGTAPTGEPLIAIDPPGPHRDQQRVTVTVPHDYAKDWLNEGTPRLCAEVREPAATTDSCDPFPPSVPYEDHATSVDGHDTVRFTLRQVVFTPAGYRDCAAPEVTCRLVVLRNDGTDVSGPRLEFTGAPTAEAPSIQLATTQTPGTYTVTLRDLAPSPSWLDLRASDPASAQEHPPFLVTLCAFGDAEPVAGPYGTYPWGTYGRSAGGLDNVSCSGVGLSLPRIDPDALDRPMRVAIPREFRGNDGWSDCTVARCYLSVRRLTASGASDGRAAAVLVPAPNGLPRAERPALRIREPGPYTVGQVLTLDLANLPDDDTGLVGFCHVAQPWACGYFISTSGVGNRTRTLTIPADAANCGATGCYLEIDARLEGSPPLAVAEVPMAG